MSKIQHFVPQFFQRYFSFENNGVTIGMYNLNKGIFRNHAEIKTQSARNYFYGKSGKLENWLSKLEGRAAPLFQAMWREERLPAYGSKSHFDMLHFMIIMDGRNPRRFDMLRQYKELIENTKSNITGESLPRTLIPSLEQYQTEEGMLAALTGAEQQIRELIDLQYKLIKNETKYPFILSDNPLIIYNQLLEKRKWHFMSQRNYGFVGTQFFLPVNDRYMIALYDRNVYRLGNRKDRVLSLDDDESVHQLNVLQFLNASENVNFNHRATELYIRTLFEKSKRYQKANHATLKFHRLEHSSPILTETSQEIELSITDLQTQLSIKGLKFTSKAVAVKLDPKFAAYRKGIVLNKEKIYPVATLKKIDRL